MGLGHKMAAYRRRASDNDEAGSCFYCHAFIHQSDQYVLILTELLPDPRVTDHPPEETGAASAVCFDCAQKIGKATRLLVDKDHSQQKPAEDTGEWYELAEWDQLAESEEKQFAGVSYQIRGPLENVMVVVPEIESLPCDAYSRINVLRDLHTAVETELKRSEWEGSVTVIPSDIKLTRLRKKSTA